MSLDSNESKKFNTKKKYDAQYKRLQIYCTDDEYSKISDIKKEKKVSFVKLAKDNLFLNDNEDGLCKDHINCVQNFNNSLNEKGRILKKILDSEGEFSGKYGITLQNTIEHSLDDIFDELIDLRRYLTTTLR